MKSKKKKPNQNYKSVFWPSRKKRKPRPSKLKIEPPETMQLAEIEDEPDDDGGPPELGAMEEEVGAS
jgi:hypothetical protein